MQEKPKQDASNSFYEFELAYLLHDLEKFSSCGKRGWSSKEQVEMNQAQYMKY